jgi:hypothetical protein
LPAAPPTRTATGLGLIQGPELNLKTPGVTVAKPLESAVPDIFTGTTPEERSAGAAGLETLYRQAEGTVQTAKSLLDMPKTIRDNAFSFLWNAFPDQMQKFQESRGQMPARPLEESKGEQREGKATQVVNEFMDGVKDIHKESLDEIAKEHGLGGSVAQSLVDGGVSLAINLAMLRGVSGHDPAELTGSASMMRRAAVQNAKVSAAVYVSTPGTPEEKMKSALNTAAYMGVPTFASLAPSHWMAMTGAILANMGLNSETYVKGISAARAQAEKEGKPENWPIYAAMNLGPEVMQDIMFGIGTRSINENAYYTPKERVKAEIQREKILREWQEKKAEIDATENDLQARFRAGDPEARDIIGKRHGTEQTAFTGRKPGAASTVADVGIPGEVGRPAPADIGAGGLLPARRVLNVPASIGPDNVSTDAGRVAAMIREQAKTRAPEERAIMRVFADAVEQAKTPEEYQATIQAANEELLTDRSKIPGQTAVDAVQNRPGADEINKSKLDSILTVPPTPPNQIPTVQAPSGVITKREPGAGPSLTQQPTTEVSDAIKTGKEPEGRVGEHIGTARREDIRPYSAQVRQGQGGQAVGGDRVAEGAGRTQGADGLKKPVLPPKRAKLPVEAAKLVERVEAPAAGALPSDTTSAPVTISEPELKGASHGQSDITIRAEINTPTQKGLVGYSTIAEDYDSVQLQYIEVRPEYRRKGIGTKLIKASEDYAKSKGKKFIWSGTTDEGEALKKGIAKEPAPPSGAERPEMMTPDATPFNVDDKLFMSSPFSGDTSEVNYRGSLPDGKAVIWTGKSQMSVPMEWLSRTMPDKAKDAERKPISQTPALSKVTPEPAPPMAGQQEVQLPVVSLPSTKAELVKELIGEEPATTAVNRSDWVIKRNALVKRTISDLQKEASAIRKIRSDSQIKMAETRKIIPEVQKIADAAGSSWRGAINEHLKSQGITPIPNTDKGETIAIASGKIAERRIRQQAEQAKPAEPAPKGAKVTPTTKLSAASVAERAGQAWGSHAVDVVEPLEKQVRNMEHKMFLMIADSKSTTPETPSKSRMSKKEFLSKYGFKDKDEANAEFRKQQSELENKKAELKTAQEKLSELSKEKELANEAWRNESKVGVSKSEPPPEGARGEKAEPVVKRKIPEAKSVMKAKVEMVETKSGDVNVSVPSADKSDIKPSQQKKYLLAQIDKVVEQAPMAKDLIPDPVDALSKWDYEHLTPTRKDELTAERLTAHKSNIEKFGKVTIEVPGDGTFEILNTRQSLEAFRERAKKFPLSTLESKQTGSKPVGPTTISKESARPKDQAELQKVMKPFVSTDEERVVLQDAHVEDGTMVATDGKRMAILLDVKGPTTKHEGDYPTAAIKQAVPGYREGKLPDLSDHQKAKVSDTEQFIRQLRQALSATSGDRGGQDSVDLFIMPDGKVAMAEKREEVGEYRSADISKGKFIGNYQIQFLEDAAMLMRKTGNTEFSVNWKDDILPLVLTGKREYAIIMPRRGVDVATKYGPSKDEEAQRVEEAKNKKLEEMAQELPGTKVVAEKPATEPAGLPAGKRYSHLDINKGGRDEQRKVERAVGSPADRQAQILREGERSLRADYAARKAGDPGGFEDYQFSPEGFRSKALSDLTGDARLKILDATLTKSGRKMQLSSIARKYDLDLANEADHERAMKELVAKITEERTSKPNVWQRFEEAIGASKREKVPQKVSERGKMPVETQKTVPATGEAQEQGVGEIEAGKAVEPPVEAVKTPEIEAKPDLPSLEESGFKSETDLDAAYKKDGLKQFGQTRDQFLMWKWCQSLGKYVQFTRQPRGK